MKEFLEMSKKPFIIATTAAILFCIDALIAPLFMPGASFLWIAFLAWTITIGMPTKEKGKFFVGNILGFISGVGMFWMGQISDMNLIGIGITALVGVFMFNFLFMFLDSYKKYLFYSVAGVFMGVSLVFSGFGVGLTPEGSGNTVLAFGILVVYSLLGYIGAFVSTRLMNQWVKKEEVDKEKK